MSDRLSKSDIAGILRDIAALLEFHDENPFKSRAYENAARALAAEPAALDDLIGEEGRLENIKDIGKSIAKVIRETATTGNSSHLDELRGSTPAGICQLMSIPNLGPKKIRALYEKLGITSAQELEEACKSGAVAQLAGFGEKSGGKILAGIEQTRKFAGQFLYTTALAAAAPLLKTLRACTAVARAETAGSLRRCKEIVRDLDFVASSENPRDVMDYFITLPGVAQVINFGETKTSVLLSSGIQADLRVVAGHEFASALQYFTGSKEHNTQLRGLAKKQGLRANEYGIFHVTDKTGEGPRDGKRVAALDETAFYKSLGLDYIPPELREGMGEIEAAEAHNLPRLITLDDYRGVLHCHSTWSDGAASIRDMALAARDTWRLEYIAICDHSEAAAYARGIKRGDLARQHEEIDRLNKEFRASEFSILKGCECDILTDGSLDYPDEYLDAMDIVVASIHSRFQMSEADMTARLLRAVENPRTDVLGHISGRLLLAREAYPFDAEKVLARAAECDTAIEINGDPQRLDLDWRLCRRAKQLGCRFSINPDAHSIEALRYIVTGINVARKGWLAAGDVINCREWPRKQHKMP